MKGRQYGRKHFGKENIGMRCVVCELRTRAGKAREENSFLVAAVNE